MMYARYLLYLAAWLLAALAGMFGGYHLARYFGIGVSIWGNSGDGFHGDAGYKAEKAGAWFRRLWPSWWWSCIRNPANNLLRHTLNADGVIEDIQRRGNLTVVWIGGRPWFFYYNRGSRYLVKFGWRFWDMQIQVGERYSASFVFNP